MAHIAKMLFYLLRELIFDNKDEYDYKNIKFNTRKFLILILISLSFFGNAWLFYRFMLLASEHIKLKEAAELCQKEAQKHTPPAVKKPPKDSLDVR